MKIAFVCPSISRTSGGIFEVERKLAQGLARLPGTSLNVFGPSDKDVEEDLPLWRPLEPRYFPYSGPASFRYSPKLRRAFLASSADISHLHALWTYNSTILPEWAARWKRPYLVTTHGMLDKWALLNSRWKKRIALGVYELTCLNGAACIHVTSEAELRSVREFGLSNPICVIRNGVDLPSDRDEGPRTMQQQAPWFESVPQGRKVMLYLGRIHPKKGLANLLRAWAHAKASKENSTDWALAIAGWDQSGHERELRSLAAELNLLSSVTFLGPQFGMGKSACYQNCNAFILPSVSEGLPIAVLEAWSYGKPVLMTPECNLPEGFSKCAALKINTNETSIANGLTRLFRMSPDEAETMGRDGRALVKSQFVWPKIAREMHSVYSWILGSERKPVCVVD